MIRAYLDAAMARATYKALSEDGSYYGEIPGFEGVQASAKTLAECRNTLEETLERWALVSACTAGSTCLCWMAWTSSSGKRWTSSALAPKRYNSRRRQPMIREYISARQWPRPNTKIYQ